MNTYIKTKDSTQFAAIRATRAQVLAIIPSAEFVPATAKLLSMAKRGSIPTLVMAKRGSIPTLVPCGNGLVYL